MPTVDTDIVHQWLDTARAAVLTLYNDNNLATKRETQTAAALECFPKIESDHDIDARLTPARESESSFSTDAITVLLLAAQRGLLPALDMDLVRGVPEHRIRGLKGETSWSKMEVTPAHKMSFVDMFFDSNLSCVIIKL